MSDLTTQPLHSFENEQALLGAVLGNNRLFDSIAATLAASDFYGPRNARIFEAIAVQIGAGGVADCLSVGDALATADTGRNADMLTYLVGLVDSVPSASRVRQFAARIRTLADRRALLDALGEAMQIAQTLDDVAAAVDRITTLVTSTQRGAGHGGPITLAQVAAARVAHYEALEAGTIEPGWRTHIAGLDARLNGGLRAGNLYVLAARPSVGKSSLAESIALGMADDGRPTLFCSLEMSRDEVADRGVCYAGQVSYHALMNAKMSHEDWVRTANALEKIAPLPFHLDDQPAMTLQDVRRKAKSVRGLKVLVIDYLQLMGGNGARRHANRNAEIEEISRGLKALAKELGIAVLALSQLNRDVEKRATNRPNLSDLRDSGAIEQDADVVMFLWEVRTLEQEGRKVLGLGIDKNRQGRTGDVALDFFGDLQCWQQSDADIRPERTARSRKDDL